MISIWTAIECRARVQISATPKPCCCVPNTRGGMHVPASSTCGRVHWPLCVCVHVSASHTCGWKVVTMNCVGPLESDACLRSSLATVVLYWGSKAASISSNR